ncbi:hypothetical protein ACA910_015903 [Epithemia clementina (nom. ined.)]
MSTVWVGDGHSHHHQNRRDAKEVTGSHSCLSSSSSLSSCNSKNVRQLPVEIRSFIRLRPLNKKERDDHVVVEISKTNHNSKTSVRHHHHHQHHHQHQRSDVSYPSVFLKYPPRSEIHHNTSASPFASPEGTARVSNHEMEFQFNQVFGEAARQDGDIFAEIGRPMSLAAMEPLFSDRALRKTHVNIAVGTAGSGKTFICLGSCSQNLKRKVASDGIIPRMADSLFGQYQRLSSIKKNVPFVKSCYFVVKVTALQVNQPKNPKTSSAEKGKLHDLLHFSRVTPKAAPQTKKCPSPVERSSSNATSSTESAGHSSSEGESLGSIEKALYIDQNPLTHDFRVANAQVRQCRSSEEAREALQDIVVGIRKVRNRRHECHVLVQMEPVLVDAKTGDTVRKGGKIAFLDMASFEDQNRSKPRNRVVSTRLKDSMPNRCDAHASVIHCLRSIFFNELLRQGKDPTASESDAVSDITMITKQAIKMPMARQVPFLQHKITMLLQPFFSPHQSDRTVVTMMLAVSPGHRDYMEKKELLTEIESLWLPFHRTFSRVSTGLKNNTSEAHEKHEEKVRQAKTMPRRQHRESDDTKDEDAKPLEVLPPPPVPCMVKRKRHDAVVIAILPSITQSSSESSDDFSLPPPIAPPVPCLRPAQDLIRRASAPIEDDDDDDKQVHDSCCNDLEKVLIPMDRTPVSDFPGVAVGMNRGPAAIEQSPSYNSRNLDKAPNSHIARKERGTSSKHSSKPPYGYPPKSSLVESMRGFSQNANGIKTQPVTKNLHHEQPGKKKWSRTVEITTTTVESSDDADSPSHTPRTSTETVDSNVSERRGGNGVLRNEMEDLRRENEILQEQLKRLKVLKSSKAVSWKDSCTDPVSSKSELDVDDLIPQPPIPGARPAAQYKPATTTGTRLMDSPLLKEKIAKYHSTQAPVVSSTDGFQNRMFANLSSSLASGSGVVSSARTMGGFQLRDPQKQSGHSSRPLCHILGENVY